jgi:hypothetical protein
MVERAGLIRFCLFNFRWIKIQCYNMNRGYAILMHYHVWFFRFKRRAVGSIHFVTQRFNAGKKCNV